MSKSARLGASDFRAIFTAVGECRALGDDPAVWRNHFGRALARLVGADVVMMGETVGLQTGRPTSLGATFSLAEPGFDLSPWQTAYRELGPSGRGEPTVDRVMARAAGPAGEVSAARALGERAWDRSLSCELYYRAAGLDANLFSFHPVPGAPDAFSGIIVTRTAGRRAFGSRETNVIREAHATVVSLMSGPLARFTEPAPSDLPRRPRQVLKCLLEGDSDKQVARRLGLSPWTVNQYTKAIYRHFGVSTRAELLARWIRRGWGAAARWADGIEDPGLGS
jgi:DNA-binding CsgD family transcriptional regulator